VPVSFVISVRQFDSSRVNNWTVLPTRSSQILKAVRFTVVCSTFTAGCLQAATLMVQTHLRNESVVRSESLKAVLWRLFFPLHATISPGYTVSSPPRQPFPYFSSH